MQTSSDLKVLQRVVLLTSESTHCYVHTIRHVCNGNIERVLWLMQRDRLCAESVEEILTVQYSIKGAAFARFHTYTRGIPALFTRKSVQLKICFGINNMRCEEFLTSVRDV
jgi:hypothetical protein